jgi:heat-inducible transcriptional repressor
MKLSERKKKILSIVVNDYITSAQPVSSKLIAEKYMPDVSSATVRAELAGLEEMGYLTHLHTSSGRVPSKDAYKLYVDELMQRGKLSSKELNFIKEQFEKQSNDLETVFKNTVKVISELTDYTSLAYSSHDLTDKIVNIKIFRYKPSLALLLIVTETTLIRDKVIKIPADMTEDELERANDVINEMFSGKNFHEVLTVAKDTENYFNEFKEIFARIIEVLENYISDNSGKVLLEGEDKILNHPEYSDTQKVKNFLSVVTSKEKVVDLLENKDNGIEINIKFGADDKDVPDDCSIVTATYTAGGVNIGNYGVIGPLRMDYKKVVSVLEGVGKILEEMLKED